MYRYILLKLDGVTFTPILLLVLLLDDDSILEYSEQT